MSKLNNRLLKLEQQTTDKRQFVCIIHPDHTGQGYDVSDYGGGNSPHFDTREELEAFEARPDVDLLILEIVYANSM